MTSSLSSLIGVPETTGFVPRRHDLASRTASRPPRG